MNPGQTQINWSMWEAIGTISATLVALFTWLWAERIRPWMKSPKLSLEIKEGLPFLNSSTTLPDRDPPIGSWLYFGDTIRFRLRNLRKRRGTAYNVQVRAMSIYDEEGNLLKGFDPTTLVWSVTQTPEYYPLLNPTDYEYVDFLLVPRQRSLSLKIKNSETYLEPGKKYYIKVLVYAENAQPQAQTVEVYLDSIPDPDHPARRELPYYSVQFTKQIPIA